MCKSSSKMIPRLLGTLLMLSVTSVAVAQEVNIKLLGTSDVHGRVVPWSYGADIEDRSGSYAQIATYINQVRQNNKNVVLIDVGDTIQDNQVEVFAKTPEYYKDNPIPKVLNAMNYDIFVLGNHEFNFGMMALDEILNDIKAQKITIGIPHIHSRRIVNANSVLTEPGM